MITVLAWLWSQPNGRTDYSAQHVNIWADMVGRHLQQPHRIACVTDMPTGLNSNITVIPPPREFEDVRIPTWGEHRPQCLRRLTMFRPDAAEIFGERFVCMDIDVVISGPLDPLFAGGEDFRIFKGTAPARPYNGSLMMIRAGSRPQVYERFTPAGAIQAGKRFLGSDQAWISHVLGPDEATWGEADGVGWWQPRGGQDHPPLLFFPGGTKPWDVIATDEHVCRHYRRDGARRGLILGRAHSVWQEAEIALDAHEYDGVIALQEAARHWPGAIDAIADSDDHALKLAAMLGFSAFTFCGRSPLTAVIGGPALA